MHNDVMLPGMQATLKAGLNSRGEWILGMHSGDGVAWGKDIGGMVWEEHYFNYILSANVLKSANSLLSLDMLFAWLSEGAILLFH